ncbi:MAG: phage portal protein [Oscillospiraceae bacterium]|nr:phage portal protein [Oscillospiraceae bacterium]
MSNLNIKNIKKVENISVVISERFSDENDIPVEFEIRAITADENLELMTNSVKFSLYNGRLGFRFDNTTYLKKLVSHCVVSPDLNDKEMQDEYGVMGADALLMKILSPGEYLKLLGKVIELNHLDNYLGEERDKESNEGQK